MDDGIATPANSFDSKWTVLAAYTFDPVKVYATYGQDKFTNVPATRRTDVNYWLVGGRASFGSHEITVNVMQRDVQSGRRGKLKNWQTSYAFDLSKRTQVYALYDAEDPNTNVASNNVRTFSVGIQHNF